MIRAVRHVRNDLFRLFREALETEKDAKCDGPFIIAFTELLDEFGERVLKENTYR